MVNPYEQIDFVLSYFKERSDLAVDISKETVWLYVEKTSEKEIKRQTFEEILQRLIDDGYVREIEFLDEQLTYHLTFNGRLFEGYSKKHESLNEERTWIKSLQVQTLKTSKQLNLVTWII